MAQDLRDASIDLEHLQHELLHRVRRTERLNAAARALQRDGLRAGAAEGARGAEGGDEAAHQDPAARDGVSVAGLSPRTSSFAQNIEERETNMVWALEEEFRRAELENEDDEVDEAWMAFGVTPEEAAAQRRAEARRAEARSTRSYARLAENFAALDRELHRQESLFRLQESLFDQLAAQASRLRRVRVDADGWQVPPAKALEVGAVLRPRPLAAVAIAALPRVLAKDVESEKADDKCLICLCEYEGEEKLVQLPCEHAYHEGCIVEWLKLRTTCPKCRAAVEKAAVEKEEVANDSDDPGDSDDVAVNSGDSSSRGWLRQVD